MYRELRQRYVHEVLAKKWKRPILLGFEDALEFRERYYSHEIRDAIMLGFSFFFLEMERGGNGAYANQKLICSIPE